MFWRKRKTPIEETVIKLGPNDWLYFPQTFSNIFISGMIGSGKTTGVGANLALGLLTHPSRPAALILCQKPDEGQRFVNYAKSVGRSSDVIHVKPKGPHTIDVLDYEVSHGGIEQAKSLIGTIMEVANRNRSRNSSDSYWPESAERQMGYAMLILRMAGLATGFKEVLDFCQSLPTSPEQLKDFRWRRSSYAANCLLIAAENYEHDQAFQMAGNWFCQEWPELSDKTRSIVQSVTLNTLDKLLSSQFAELICQDTTFTPEKVMNDGEILIWDVPGATFGPPANWSAVAVKLLFQRAAMRRPLVGDVRPLILWCDEAANFCIPELDAMFLSQSRQFKCICVNIIQNIPLAVTALGSSEAARHQTYAWLSNHATVIGAANSDPETNKYLSAFAGEERVEMFGGSSSQGNNYDLFDDFMGKPQGNVNISWSQQYRPALPPEKFNSLLRGGKETGFLTEGYVFQSGRLFSNGKGWIKGSWRQRF